ncbi:hypothetical protein [Halobacterium rubrum]|uniref:hypothetical protein n=1 Tax=Halobacterium TaxID=2239 RepID=UPI001F36122F|nr:MULTISPECIES: hypothetical protein [Halobacterium]MDH5021125.1 hypothetical protein [Halobacterium rubrum]
MIELLDLFATVGVDVGTAAAEAAGAASGGGGPPVDLPDPVPEFVGDVLGSVRSFVDGSAEKLGKTVSDLTPAGL